MLYSSLSRSSPSPHQVIEIVPHKYLYSDRSKFTYRHVVVVLAVIGVVLLMLVVLACWHTGWVGLAHGARATWVDYRSGPVS